MVGCMQILICDFSCAFSFQDMPGVVAFLSAKDIPGRNSFVPVELFALHEDEEVCRFSRNVNAVTKMYGGTNIRIFQQNETHTSEAVSISVESQLSIRKKKTRHNRNHLQGSLCRTWHVSI
jgi:xanthine dehydrogenase molybdopterin-binding subunit B